MFEGTSCINDPIIISPDLAFRAEATTGEGSIWHPDRNTLFWVDIEGKTLYEYIPDLQNCRSWQFDRMVSTVVPETDSTVVVALQNEIIRVNLTDGNTTSIAPIPDNNGKIRCNDGKCAPSGRLWIGRILSLVEVPLALWLFKVYGRTRMLRSLRCGRLSVTHRLLLRFRLG